MGEPTFSASDETKTNPSDHNPEKWRASKQVKMIMACLFLVCLIVAIDASILVPALPVGVLFLPAPE